MVRQFLISLALILMFLLGMGTSPILAEQQYSQSQQIPAQEAQSYSQKPYAQEDQIPAQVQSRPAQKPYAQTQAKYEQEKQYSQSEQKPESKSEK